MNVLTLASVYINDVVHFVKINKDNLKQGVEICGYNLFKFWILTLSFITHVLEKE